MANDAPRRQARHATMPHRISTDATMVNVPSQNARGQSGTMVDAMPKPAPGNRSRRGQRAIQDQIKEWVLAEGLATGDPMPTEAELVERLGISRNSVREALKALQALGIVEIRHGFGTYVGECSLEPFTDALVFRGRKSLRGDRREMFEILNLRQALEIGLIGQLIEVVDDTSLEKLADCLANLERYAGKGQAGDDADRAFHEQLYAPLGNQLMSQLLRVFWDVYHDLSRELVQVPEAPAGIVAAHRAIYQAVAARDATRAVTAVVDHFKGIQERLHAS